MNKHDIDIYNNRYQERLRQYGYDPKSLGWGGGKEKQIVRFENLLQIGCERGDSILDVGCGFADLYGYLNEINFSANYLGIDINEALLGVAKKVYPTVNLQCVDILQSEIPTSFDWVISSGVFNAKLKYEDNLHYIKQMLKKMYEISTKGVAVDFMSTYVDFQHPDAYHTSPQDLIDFAKYELKTKLVLRMDYLPYEYCIYLKK